MFFYVQDKIAAQKNAWRTPKSRLLFFALFGPFGACAAMHLLRHKTWQLKFYLVPVFAILHIVLFIWFLMYA
ncbi:MAG: DUF1294 domain-containing protein [Methanoregula sp.]|nr:DUF1294 domain-containing protein [Methanoregula sp.]